MTPVAAGLAAGYSIAIKPSNSIFLVAPLLLFLVEKRRALLTFAAGLAPALLTLAIWKYRGLGELAAAPAQEVRLASGVGGLLDRIHNPQLNSYAHFRTGAAVVARALLGRARDGVVAGGGDDRAPRALPRAPSCSSAPGSRSSWWPRPLTFRRRSRTRASGAS